LDSLLVFSKALKSACREQSRHAVSANRGLGLTWCWRFRSPKLLRYCCVPSHTFAREFLRPGPASLSAETASDIFDAVCLCHPGIVGKVQNLAKPLKAGPVYNRISLWFFSRINIGHFPTGGLQSPAAVNRIARQPKRFSHQWLIHELSAHGAPILRLSPKNDNE
jgi:hypothetical protein